eukprot:scaffold39719_cov19-Tisochrysis_lutea.AAC.1
MDQHLSMCSCGLRSIGGDSAVTRTRTYRPEALEQLVHESNNDECTRTVALLKSISQQSRLHTLFCCHVFIVSFVVMPSVCTMAFTHIASQGPASFGSVQDGELDAVRLNSMVAARRPNGAPLMATTH